jgi:hypothetical protein
MALEISSSLECAHAVCAMSLSSRRLYTQRDAYVGCSFYVSFERKPVLKPTGIPTVGFPMPSVCRLKKRDIENQSLHYFYALKPTHAMLCLRVNEIADPQGSQEHQESELGERTRQCACGTIRECCHSNEQRGD